MVSGVNQYVLEEHKDTFATFFHEFTGRSLKRRGVACRDSAKNGLGAEKKGVVRKGPIKEEAEEKTIACASSGKRGADRVSSKDQPKVKIQKRELPAMVSGV